MRILFVAARFPHPLRLGYQVRAYHQLRLLGRRHRITLVAFAAGPPAAASMREVRAFCEEIFIVPLGRTAMAASLARGLFGSRPLQAALFDTAAMRSTVARLVSEHHPDVVHVQLARMAPHAESDGGVPRVIDLIDALSLNMARRRRLDRGPMGWAAAVDARRLCGYERAICRSWSHATVVSDADRRAIGEFPNLSVNPNGVDLDRFPFHAGPRDPVSIVFTGNLGYFPNVDAVTWFVRAVLPRVREAAPRVTFTAVGARPTARLRRLAARDPQVRIHGDVADVHPYLVRSQVAVAPMRAGSGQPLKVLEAMAAGTPVVATRLATSGIATESERHLLLADDAETFAAQVLRLLRAPALGADLAAAARARVEETYPWERSVAELEAIYRAVSG